MHLKINKSVNVLSLLCFEEVEENNKAKALIASNHACGWAGLLDQRWGTDFEPVGRNTGLETGNPSRAGGQDR